MRIPDRYFRLSVKGGDKATEVRAEFVEVTAEAERLIACAAEIKAAVGRHDQSVRDSVPGGDEGNTP